MLQALCSLEPVFVPTLQGSAPQDMLPCIKCCSQACQQRACCICSSTVVLEADAAPCPPEAT